MPLFVIKARFQPTDKSEWVEGLAICLDPSTPQTFIFANGNPLVSDEINDYQLMHAYPWAKFED